MGVEHDPASLTIREQMDRYNEKQFLREVERRAGASREEMLEWMQHRAEGRSYATCDRLVDWLRSILGGGK